MSSFGTPGQKMSAALKERLRRSGRTYKTPTRSPALQKKLVDKTDISDASCGGTPTGKGNGASLHHADRLSPQGDSPSCTPVSSRIRTSPEPCKLTLNRDKDSAKNCQMMLLRESESIEAEDCGQIKISTPNANFNAEGSGDVTYSDRKRAHGDELSEQQPPARTASKRSRTDRLTSEHGIKSSSKSPPSDEMDTCTPSPSRTLKQECADLRQRVASKEEILRKLQMVKLYREKNDLTALGNLTSKWRDVVQQAIQDLHELATEPKPTLTELVDFLQIDHDFIGYDAEQEAFL